MKSKKIKQDERRRLNQATLELASIGGYTDYAIKLISLQYLCGSMVGVLAGEIELIMEQANLKSNKTISIQKGLDDAMKKYYNFFQNSIKGENTLDWANDLDKLEKVLKEWAGIKAFRPKRKAMKEAKQGIAEKHGVEVRDTNK